MTARPDNKKSVRFAYRFVGMGATAPDPLPPGEIWIDVGNRTGPAVLDHHGGKTDARSSCDLVYRHYRDWVLAPVRDRDAVTLVLHQAPDLDAISAAWLAREIINRGELPGPEDAVEAIVGAVNAHDQGYRVAEEPEANWPLIVRTRLELEEACADDRQKLAAGMGLLDTTLALLQEGIALSEVAGRLITTPTRAFLEQAKDDYLKDLAAGTVFQVELPVHTEVSSRQSAPDRPVDSPIRTEVSWQPMDGLFLNDPRSALFKELARTDREHSPRRQGFALLVVSRTLAVPGYPHPLYRHIISTDPHSGAYLQGLGRQLENLEQIDEDRAGEALPTGRERLAPGAGRHGYNVPSPWYDGRGHHFTIVDSPSVTIGDATVCASRLTPERVLAAVRRYGRG